MVLEFLNIEFDFVHYKAIAKITHDKQEMFSITYAQPLVSRSSFVGIFSLKCLQLPSWLFSIWKFHLYEKGVDIVQLVLVTCEFTAVTRTNCHLLNFRIHDTTPSSLIQY